jgi:hypothetical protein
MTADRVVMLVSLVILGVALAFGAGAAEPKKPAPAPAASEPASNLDYWLNQAKPAAATQPGGEAGKEPAAGGSPLSAGAGEFFRDDALPGVIELSNGKCLPGGVYTTREKPWIVWSEDTKSWRRIPFLTLLSIAAVVEEERMELEWRWKGMGEPEKVFTGKKYPMRRLHWKFRLIDGSYVEGATKGQPVSVEFRGKHYGPFVLHERMKGELDQTQTDLVYVKRVIISRKMMDAVIQDEEKKMEGGGAGGK